MLYCGGNLEIKGGKSNYCILINDIAKRLIVQLQGHEDLKD